MGTGMDFHRFRLLLLLGSLVCFGGSETTRAAERAERQLVHKNAVFVVEVRNPLQWAKHPLIEQDWKIFSQSAQLQSRLRTPEFGRVLAARDFLENASGQNWQEALDELTAGGIWIGLSPKPDERATMIFSARNGDAWNRLREAVFKMLDGQGQPRPAFEIYRGEKIYRLDESSAVIVGPRLLVGSQKRDLKRMMDQLLDDSRTAKVSLSSYENAEAAIKWEINLEAIRQLPGLQKALKHPAEDAGAVAVLGGWLDLLRQGDWLRGEFLWPKNSSEIEIKLTADSVEPGDGLAGFFTSDSEDKLAPLLEPPGTIYSASWYRDYQALWNQRDELLTPSALAKLEKADGDIKQQFSVFGVSFTPSGLFQQLGTQFRVVVARANETEYRVTLKNRLPAAALCVSLPDEPAFLAQADPLSRALGLVSAFGEAKMLTKRTEYGGAKLTGYWFRDDEKSAARGNQLRFNFNPTWTVARKHFVLGSTQKIVTQVIDELDRQAERRSTDEDSREEAALITDRQLFVFSELSGGLSDFREAIIQGSIFDRGLRLQEAESELEIAQDFLQSFGRLTTQAAFGNQNFEYQIRLSPNARILKDR